MTVSSPRLPPLRVTPLTPALADAWAALFRSAASACFCRYWHFEGTKNDWMARLAFSPDENEREQRALIDAGHPSAQGVVALDGDVAVGWLKVVPRGGIPKLRRLPVYRALALGDDEGVMSLGCFLVDPAHRRRGVARALLEGALAMAAAAGARAVEAYPHERGESLHDEELLRGPLALFEACGFSRVGDHGAYPVLRREFERTVSRP